MTVREAPVPHDRLVALMDVPDLYPWASLAYIRKCVYLKGTLTRYRRGCNRVYLDRDQIEALMERA